MRSEKYGIYLCCFTGFSGAFFMFWSFYDFPVSFSNFVEFGANRLYWKFLKKIIGLMKSFKLISIFFLKFSYFAKFINCLNFRPFQSFSCLSLFVYFSLSILRVCRLMFCLCINLVCFYSKFGQNCWPFSFLPKIYNLQFSHGTIVPISFQTTFLINYSKKSTHSDPWPHETFSISSSSLCSFELLVVFLSLSLFLFDSSSKTCYHIVWWCV